MKSFLFTCEVDNLHLEIATQIVLCESHWLVSQSVCFSSMRQDARKGLWFGRPTVFKTECNQVSWLGVAKNLCFSLVFQHPLCNTLVISTRQNEYHPKVLVLQFYSFVQHKKTTQVRLKSREQEDEVVMAMMRE